MKGLFYCLCFVVWMALQACSVGPEPLRYGEDACHSCRMTLMDKKFGAEVVSVKGKVFKFDDMNCMVNFLNSGTLTERDIAYKLVVDYTVPEKLITADNAFFLKSDEIRSPMASRVAAFEQKADMDRYKQSWDGIYLTWGELVTEFK
ncbi:MAG TPA: nitrous oxide reductase accessory protein NosL [Cyclobacteriaceae bacterium]|nr:nitrous oxide reductase accessory protein NosL [Cyclobacteriaceae bacterium]